MNDLLNSLIKIMPSLSYRGCCINIHKTHCTVMGKTFVTVHDAKTAVDNGYRGLKESIVRVRSEELKVKSNELTINN